MVGGTFFEGVAPQATLPLHALGSPEKGTKSEVATSPVPSQGPKVGGIATLPLCSRESPEKGTKREVAAEPLPLQSRFMMSHGEKKEKTKSNLQPFLSSSGSHLPPPGIEPRAFNASAVCHKLGHSPSLKIDALR